jgi:hypothetical protein
MQVVLQLGWKNHRVVADLGVVRLGARSALILSNHASSSSTRQALAPFGPPIFTAAGKVPALIAP